MGYTLGALDTDVVIASYDTIKQYCEGMCPYIEETQVKGRTLGQIYKGYPAPLQGKR